MSAFLGQYYILIMDEQTDFLDIASMEASEEFLKAYEGTVLLVSHDNKFVENVEDSVYVLNDQKIKQK